MPLKHIPASKLYVSEPNPSWFGNPSNEGGNPYWGTESTNWLKSRFHFSFAEYSNNKNSNFGVMRVMNDDFVQHLEPSQQQGPRAGHVTDMPWSDVNGFNGVYTGEINSQNVPDGRGYMRYSKCRRRGHVL